MSGPQRLSVTDNPAELRYELHVDDQLVGEIRYRRRPDAVVLVHTEIDPALEGHGLGSSLIEGALDDLRSRRLGVVPICPMVRAFIDQQPEYADLVVADDAVPD